MPSPAVPLASEGRGAPLPCALCLLTLPGQDCALAPGALSGRHARYSLPLLTGLAHLRQVLWVRRAPSWDPCVGGFRVLSVVLLCVIKSVGVGGVNLNSLCGF